MTEQQVEQMEREQEQVLEALATLLGLFTGVVMNRLVDMVENGYDGGEYTDKLKESIKRKKWADVAIIAMLRWNADRTEQENK